MVVFRWGCSESLFQKSPYRSANGAFLRSGAHVRSVHCAPVLENHHFRLGLPLLDSGSAKDLRHPYYRLGAHFSAGRGLCG
ncbi:hypothetical protein F9L69_11760 [Brucella melitensis]|uniref:Uncharacterized protein n=2 Tax=Brucella TaxID=234 RepID=A0AAI8EAY1_BRUSS|nr:hypothetical protein BK201_11880 [Brucella melitensis]ASU72942.1 hypothetical protein CJP69_11715 [Brucella abortus]ATN19063.1 hypothetical protein CRN66_04235 [Brucella canis]ATQ53277.1 hypothetical protein CS875_11265 [Brucella suis]ARY03708.1 hypothetical protein BK186_11885 [Brucella melitensis]